MPETLCFDLDGTLTDPAEGIFACIEHACREMGSQPPARDALREWVGPPLVESFTPFFGSEEDAHRAIAHYRERFADVGLYENELIPGIPELLEVLKGAGHTCYVVTAKPTIYAERIVEHFGLAPYFRQVHGCELDGTHNDKAELLAHVLERHALVAEHCVMIGDRRHDIDAARANRVGSVGVLWGFGDEAELREAGAAAVVARPDEIVDVIKTARAVTV